MITEKFGGWEEKWEARAESFNRRAKLRFQDSFFMKYMIPYVFDSWEDDCFREREAFIRHQKSKLWKMSKIEEVFQN